MRLIDDAKFFSGEKVTSDKFEAVVVENGWDVELNQLRLTDSQGELRVGDTLYGCLLYTSPSPRDGLLSRMPSSA